MKVLEVLDSYYPKTDGPNNVITFYAENLNEIDGVEAEIFVPKTKNYKDVQKFVVHRVKSLPAVEGYEMAVAEMDRHVKKYLKNNKVDVIHIHSPFTLGRYFVKYGKKHNIPTVYTFHTAYKEDFDRVLKRNWQKKFIMNYIMKTINLADHVLSVSEGAAKVLESYGYKKPIQVIRNGTDFVYPNNAEELKCGLNQKHNLSADDLVLLSVGRVVQNKRLDVVIDALKILDNKGLSFKFFVVGDGVYREELEIKVKKLALENKIIFTGRLPDREDIIPYYLRANLLLFPSTFDTASLAPLEAAALKLPCMLTRGCPTAEIIIENQNGYLAGETAESWAEKLEEIILNRETLENMREVCHKEVYKSWKDVVSEVHKFYQSITKK